VLGPRLVTPYREYEELNHRHIEDFNADQLE
jgi:hypothetical protein